MSLLSPQLQAFVSIANTKTVHGAADSIGITQTGITQRLRALETQLSVTLFIRSRKGMALTPEGVALLRYCKAAVDLEGQAMSQIGGAGTETAIQVNLVGPTSIVSSRIIPQVRPVLEAFKTLFMRFQVIDDSSPIELLRSGRAQLAIVSPDQVALEMDSKMLNAERYILVASAKWKRRKLSEILVNETLIDFDPQDQMSRLYLQHFKLTSEGARTNRHFVNNNDGLIFLIKDGAGYGVLTRDVADSYLKRGELIALNSGNIFENTVALAWYPRRQMPEYLQAIIDCIH